MIDVSRLTTELLTAGLPINGVGFLLPGQTAAQPYTTYPREDALPSDVRVSWSQVPTAGQNTTAANVVAAHDGRPRRLRDFWDVYQNIKALTGGDNPGPGTQKANIWGAITQIVPGSNPPRPLWATVRDRVAANAIAAVHWAAVNSGVTGAPLTDARERLVAMMLSDPQFINYLVNPVFDPSINVPGDEIIP